MKNNPTSFGGTDNVTKELEAIFGSPLDEEIALFLDTPYAKPGTQEFLATYEKLIRLGYSKSAAWRAASYAIVPIEGCLPYLDPIHTLFIWERTPEGRDFWELEVKKSTRRKARKDTLLRAEPFLNYVLAIGIGIGFAAILINYLSK